MQYSFPYILLIAFLEILAFVFDNDERLVAEQEGRPLTTEYRPFTRRQLYCTAIAVAGFLIFFGFRGFILSDWVSYYPFFHDCALEDILSFDITEQGKMEPGFVILTVACRALFDDFHFYVFVCCLITTGLLLRFFRRRINNIPLCLLIYITFEGLVISTNLMRNSIAICIFLNALPFIEKRKPIQYFALILLACTFHFTSVFFFPLYFFLHRRLNRWVFLGIFLLCNAIFLLHINIVSTALSVAGLEEFSTRIRAYTELLDQSTGISLGYLERLMTGTLAFLFLDKLRAMRPNSDIYINGLLLYLIMFFALSEFQVLSKRMCTLFAFGYWVIWIDLIRCFSVRGNRYLFIGFIYIYCILRMMGSAYLPDFKYDNVLFGADTYQHRLYMHNKTFQEN